MIVDAHAHLGFDEVFDEDFTEADLLDSQQRNGIDVTLVQPALVHDRATVMQYHDKIADLAARYPGRFYGIANPNPHLPDDEYVHEIERCLHELHFVGIKLHPFAHAVNPGGRHGRRVFALAAEYGVPIIVHSGPGLPWSNPALLAPLAEEYPQLSIIVAHAGGSICVGEAGVLAERYPNVYLEPSWTGGFHVKGWITHLGAERMLLGSDHADNAATELTKFRTIGLNDEELAWILGKTAVKLFALETVGERR
ncbi:MAG TPA: amidohydrolase family protein [Armatimonadota bacterium]|nr:amidohydrolase family protein [Armatimonadota bacterium]